MNYTIPCPGCSGPMDAGKILCSDCYRELGGHNGFPTIAPQKVASWVAAREERLEQMAQVS